MTKKIQYVSQLYKIAKLLKIVKVVLSVVSLGTLYLVWELLTRPAHHRVTVG
ncbi:hypothetical protein [Chitinophaga rhizophila]|uniref:Uncharacterized protein n=1 Tax=Chitinophaga rhizophila TaxID=2866212 RepID=A0ABS7GDD7_9BACT|nr:hypothetical protein [Chitinophaga rhizophila]MBW8685689.1 hypothetical protein [Chitinophaga rhizophila]